MDRPLLREALSLSRFRRLLRRGAVLVIATVITAIAVSVLALDTARPPASAAEAGESTTGTASTISPSTVAVGGTLTYTLSGFPPGATIQISVDDDTLGSQGPGQGVIGTATVDEHGITSGAVELPIYLAKGSHWLRFGVSAGRDIPTSEVRTMDYTNKSPYFTVGDVTIIGGSDKASPMDLPTEAPTDSPTQAASSPSPIIAFPTAAEPESASPTASTSPSTTQIDIRPDGGGAQPPAVEVETPAFPLFGASLFLLTLLLVLLTTIVVVSHRRLTAGETAVPP